MLAINLLINFMFGICLSQVREITSTSTQQGAPESSPNCSRVQESAEEKVAHVGWPFVLDCMEMNSVYLDALYDYDDDYGDDQVQCQIWDLDQRRLLLNTTFGVYDNSADASFYFTDLQNNASVNFEMVVSIPSDNSCFSKLIHLNLTKLENQTCLEAVNSSLYLSRQAKLGGFVTFSCEVPRSGDPKLQLRNESTYTYRWHRDCAELPSGTVGSKTEKNGLEIPAVTYDHPGIYTCEVTHNGQTRYTVHHRVCVKPPISLNEHSIKCTHDVVRVKLGQIAILQCTGNLGQGSYNPIGITVSWKKKPVQDPNMTRCANHVNRETPSTNNPNVKCAYTMNPIPCLYHIASEEERKPQTQRITMNLTIENVQESDLGEYVVTLSTAHRGFSTVDATVALQTNPIPSLVKTTNVVGICVGVVCFVLIVAVLSYLVYRRRSYRSRRQKSNDDTSTISEPI